MPEKEYDLGAQYGEVYENYKLGREGLLEAQAKFAKILGLTREEQEAQTTMTTNDETRQTEGTVTPQQAPQETLNQNAPTQTPKEVNKENEAVKDTGDSSTGLAGIKMVSWLGLERRAVDFSEADLFVFRSELIPDKLPPIAPALLTDLGTCKIKASFQSSPYTPGEGFLLRCTACYFATLPFIGHSVLTLSVVHYLARKGIKMDLDSSPAIVEGVKIIEGCNLGPLGVIVSQLVIPPRALSSSVLEDAMPLGDMVGLIDQIAVCDLDTKLCFSVIGHVLGLKEPLPGMPEFLKHSDLIINFVNAVAKGQKPKEIITVNWPSAYAGTVRADTINLHGMINENDLAASALGKNS